MADVDMTDAPAASGSAAPAKKVVGKAAKGTAENGDGKKRFEVKKVRPEAIYIYIYTAHSDTDSSRSGMLSLSGPGISSSTTALSAVTISWIYVRPIIL